MVNRVIITGSTATNGSEHYYEIREWRDTQHPIFNKIEEAVEYLQNEGYTKAKDKEGEFFAKGKLLVHLHQSSWDKQVYVLTDSSLIHQENSWSKTIGLS